MRAESAEIVKRPSSSGVIYVCSIAALQEAVRVSRAKYLITLINKQMMAELATPEGIEPDHHIRLVMNDIEHAVDGLIMPNAEHVNELVSFASAWARDAPLLINCRAGRSRSTAAAFIIECASNPDRSESDIAQSLRSLSPTAAPNRVLIRLADAALERNGRMIEAVEKMGPGDPAHNHIFCFDTLHV